MTQSEYLEIVKEQIRQKQMQEELAEELGCHIEDQAEVYRSLGYPVEKVMEKAVEDMGDPVETGVQLDLVHQPKLDKKLLGILLFIWFIGGLLRYIAWSMGTYGDARILDISRIMVYFMIPLVLFIRARKTYEFYRKNDWKIEWFLYMVMAAILGIIVQCDFWADVSLLMLFSLAAALPGYSSLVFYGRNQGKNRFHRLILMAGIAVLISSMTGSYYFVLFYACAYAGILTTGLKRHWYPCDGKGEYLKIWLLPGIMLVAGAWMLGKGLIEKRYVSSVAAYLKQKDIPGILYGIFGKNGWMGTVIWTVFILFVLVWMLHDLRKITNEFAYVNCLGILLAFCVLLSHSVFCVFGFGKVTQICVPVLSFGESYTGMMISMLGGGLLGDFLQFHKNSPVLPRNIKFTE